MAPEIHNPRSASLHGRFFLTGFMGSGKTYWGNKWAESAGINFYDIDDIVEEGQENSIADIFAEKGEEHFRELETTALRNFVNQKNVIVACGGGTPCFNNNMAWMNENGTSIYLNSSPGKILYRLMTEKEKRPLIKNLDNNELLFYITGKIKEREAFYKQAEIILDVDHLPENYIPDFLKL